MALRLGSELEQIHKDWRFPNLVSLSFIISPSQHLESLCNINFRFEPLGAKALCTVYCALYRTIVAGAVQRERERGRNIFKRACNWFGNLFPLNLKCLQQEFYGHFIRVCRALSLANWYREFKNHNLPASLRRRTSQIYHEKQRKHEKKIHEKYR